MTKEEMERRILEITGPAQTDYIWSLWVEFVAEWLERYGDGVPDPDYDPEILFDGALSPSETRHMVAAWREEMGGIMT